MRHIESAIAYVTSQGRLLAFEPGSEDTPGQHVPNGLMQPGATAAQCAWHAAQAATGLTELTLVRFLGDQELSPTAAPGRPRRQHYFHFVAGSPPAESWSHYAAAATSGEPPTLHRCSWLPLDQELELADGHGAKLEQLRAGLAAPSSQPRSTSGARVRYAARVLLLDAQDRVLLLRGLDGQQVYWLTPGGGLQAGEDYSSAALREAHEELGVRVELGPLVWQRRHVFPTQHGILDQTECFFIARADSTTIAPVLPDWYVTGHQWWSAAELLASSEVFAPRALPRLFSQLLSDGYPDRPVDAGK